MIELLKQIQEMDLKQLELIAWNIAERLDELEGDKFRVQCQLALSHAKHCASYLHKVNAE